MTDRGEAQVTFHQEGSLGPRPWKIAEERRKERCFWKWGKAMHLLRGSAEPRVFKKELRADVQRENVV